MSYFIGVDLGTSSVKVLLVDDKGKVIGEKTKKYCLSMPKPLWSEQNPTDWYNCSIEAIKELIVPINKKEVKGLSFGGQMHGLVLLDENDQIIRPAILWNDGRSVKEVDFLNNIFSKEKLTEYTGNIAFAGFTAPKLLWVKNNEIENFKRIKKIMLPKDYLAYQLTGVFATDYSDASGTLYLDCKNKKWSKKMLDLLGISENFLPKIFESYDVIGCLKPEIAKQLELENVKVIIGAGDNVAAAVGTGCINNGDCNISLGTSGTIFYSCDKFNADYKIPVHSFCHANGKYHLMGCILSAASCNSWWVESILKSKFKDSNSSINKIEGTNVLFAPYLMGERCPYNDPTLSGAFFNLKLNTTQEEMSLAVLEGVAFAIKDCFQLINKLSGEIKSATICGGGCNTPMWPNIICNVIGVPINFVETEQGPCYGAALLAMVGCGVYKDVNSACKAIVHVKKQIMPNQKLVGYYKNKYKQYRKLHNAIKAI